MQINKSYNELGMPTNYSCQGIQDMSFDFDLFTGNLNSRSDNLKELTETFEYDDLDRLTEHIRPFIFNYINTSIEDYSQNYSYFDNGNIKTKSDVSLQNYQYHPTKSHAVVGVNNVINPLASLQEQTISYNSAQDAISISEDAYELSFNYGPNNNRVQSILKYQGQVQQTKTYLSNMEIIEGNGTTRNVHYIEGGDGLAAVYVEENGIENYYFVFKDYLGSILTLADKNGNVVQEQSFDAWGRYRNTEDWTYEDVNPPTLDIDGDFSWLRGYTGHEYLPQFSLIHMNGRLYDPLLGRMLSPDNFVHTDFGTQGYNRYSYAGNNPLKYTDPSGEIIAPIIIGAAIGAFSGYKIGQAQGAQGWDLAGYVLGGAVVGGISGGLAHSVATSGIAFANTASIVTGSFTNSVGMHLVTGGKTDVSVGFGFGSYNFSTGEFGYLGKRGNSALENIGYGLGALANVSDILAGFKPESVELRTENISTPEDKDIIGHSQIVDKNGTPLVDWGPDVQLTKGNAFRSVRGTNSYEQGLALPSENMKWNALTIDGINTSRISNWSPSGKYNLCYNNCVSQTSRALNASGAFNIGIHPYLLHGKMALRSAGIRPYLFSSYLYQY